METIYGSVGTVGTVIDYAVARLQLIHRHLVLRLILPEGIVGSDPRYHVCLITCHGRRPGGKRKDIHRACDEGYTSAEISFRL